MNRLLFALSLMSLPLFPFTAFAEKSETPPKSAEFLPILEEEQATPAEDGWWDEWDEENETSGSQEDEAKTA